MIRNLVIRVVAKHLGQLLLGKEEAGSVTETDFLLLHYGIPPALRPPYDISSPHPAELSVNMGVLFA